VPEDAPIVGVLVGFARELRAAGLDSLRKKLRNTSS